MQQEILRSHKASVVALDAKMEDELLFTQDLRSLGHKVTYIQNASEAMSLRQKNDIFLVAESSLKDLKNVFPRGTIVAMSPSQLSYRKTTEYLNKGADHVHITSESPEVLSAHMQAIQNRMISPEVHKPVENTQGLKIDIERLRVENNGQNIPVTKNEFEILFALTQNTNRAIPNQELISLTNTGDINKLNGIIRRLRQKIDVDIVYSTKNKGYMYLARL
ncbi:MAG: response regulator transcription factor [Candidatus Levybacteria bacterium]|nr:response regulator transcription factor [Candidatus Levybacteria bacterium]MBP9815084.1 response regulator transcription factor [Candidatus Levybacteria bacterium]